jgi:ATPase inhibitor, mitochondrial
MYRSITSTSTREAEGDVGALRAGGQAHSDAFNRREKAAEDMYIREREKVILSLLREKVAKQEQVLARDKAILAQMEDQYGHIAEELNRSL